MTKTSDLVEMDIREPLSEYTRATTPDHSWFRA